VSEKSQKSSREPERQEGEGFDVVLLHGRTPDGEGASVVRMRPGRLEAGEVRPLKDGRPIPAGGQVIRLAPRSGTPHLYDVDVQCEVPRPQGSGQADPAPQTVGPPQVATTAYRESWERTFGPRQVKALLN
jgi:hypothetical protein